MLRYPLAALTLLFCLTAATAQEGLDPDLYQGALHFWQNVQSGNFPKAASIGDWMFKQCRERYGDEHANTATWSNNAALAYKRLGKYERASELYNFSLKAARQAFPPDDPRTTRTLNNLGALHLATGDYPKARSCLTQALATYRKTVAKNDARLAETINNLGALYFQLGDYPKAEQMYRLAVEIQGEISGPKSGETATSLHNLAEVYREMGSLKKAEEYLRLALEGYTASWGPEHPFTATTRMSLADLQAPELAEAAYAEVLKVFEKHLTPNHPRVAIVLDRMAGLASHQGQHQRAVELARRATNIKVERLDPQHPLVSISQANLAFFLHRLGQLEEAERLYRRVLKAGREAFGSRHGTVTTVLENLACVMLDQKKPDQALELAREVSGLQDEVLTKMLSFTSEQQRLDILSNIDPYFLYAASGSAPDLALAVLRHKGLTLDAMLEDVAVARASKDPEVEEKLESLRQAKHRLHQWIVKPDYDPNSPSDPFGRLRRLQLEERVESIEAELARHFARSQRPRRALQTTVQQVQTALPAETTLVEFLRYRGYLPGLQFEERYGAVLVPSQGEPSWVDLGPAEPIDRLVRRAGRAVRAGAGLSSVLRRMYELVWAPLAPQLGRRVVISPDSQLNFVSFATLLSPDDRFLAEEHDLRFVSTGRDLLQKSPKGDGDLLIFANPEFGGKGTRFRPLPGTADESASLQKIARQKDWQVRAYEGSQATEERLRACNPGMLHLATHGFLMRQVGTVREPTLSGATPEDRRRQRLRWQLAHYETSRMRRNPMHRSGLALSRAQATIDGWETDSQPAPSDGDGIVTAFEVGGLSLQKTWLVTMSACDTGLGEATDGEGVLGLRRAFAGAGAQNLLMTLWPVKDVETARFMAQFYQQLDASPAATLAEVQREWLVRLRSEQGLDAAVNTAGPFLLTVHGGLSE